jgi:Kae1-associated kinase Bud32
MKLLASGAEAEVYCTTLLGRSAVVKRRVEKKYRIKALDEALRATRTRQEARLLHAAKLCGVRCPVVYGIADYELTVELVRGRLLRNALGNGTLRLAGAELAKLHAGNIAHGDFTTANVIVMRSGVCLFDFGLGAFSSDVEDKAVDLLTMKASLSDAMLFGAFLAGYSEYEKSKEVEKRMEEIEKRGRYVQR